MSGMSLMCRSPKQPTPGPPDWWLWTAGFVCREPNRQSNRLEYLQIRLKEGCDYYIWYIIHTLTSRSNSTRYRMNSLGKPNCVRRKLSETESRSKRSRVLWPRPCRSRSQSKMAIGIAMLWVRMHLLFDMYVVYFHTVNIHTNAAVILIYRNYRKNILLHNK